MPKTNWTKVEGALSPGLEKMKRDELLRQADAAKAPPKAQAQTSPEMRSRIQLQLSLKLLVEWLWKGNKKLCEELKITKLELTRLITKPEKLSEEDWVTVQKLHDKCVESKAKSYAKGPAANDASLIQAEKKKHIYKRHGVSDKWLPLK